MPSIKETTFSFKIFSKFFITRDVSATGLKSLKSMRWFIFGTGIMVDVYHTWGWYPLPAHIWKSTVNTSLSWSVQWYKVRPQMPSGPAAIVSFTFLNVDTIWILSFVICFFFFFFLITDKGQYRYNIRLKWSNYVAFLTIFTVQCGQRYSWGQTHLLGMNYETLNYVYESSLNGFKFKVMNI